MMYNNKIHLISVFKSLLQKITWMQATIASFSFLTGPTATSSFTHTN